MQREEMAQDARRIVDAKRKMDLANTIQLKIFYDTGHRKLLRVSKHATLADVTVEAVARFELRIAMDCARLRAYSESMALPRETYDGREHCSLVELSITSSSCIYLETRASADIAWAVYDPTELSLRIRRYVSSTAMTPEAFTEPPELVQLPGDARLVDLLSLLSAKLTMNRNRMRLLAMRNVGSWSITTTVLNATNDVTTLQTPLDRILFLLWNRSSIYVEAIDDLASSPSLAKELFVALAHIITLQVKTTEPTLLRAKNVEGDAMKLLRPETFKLRRAKEIGTECKDLDMSVESLGFPDNCVLWVELGTPLRAPVARTWRGSCYHRVDARTTSCRAHRFVSEHITVCEMKATILSDLQRTHPSAKHLRIWDLCPDRRLQRVLSDRSTLGKTSPISLVAQDAWRHPHAFSAVLFDRAHLTFGREMELVFPTLSPGSHWMDLLLLEIQSVFGIPPYAVLLAKLPQTLDVDVTEMAQLSWIDRDHGRRIGRISSLAASGDRLVIADACVPSKVLSRNELLDLQPRIDLELDTDNTCLVNASWSTTTVEMASLDARHESQQTKTSLVLPSAHRTPAP
ncbi:hypothetical protein SDRG_12988 [Saprolegnia diclina VS20]|uniref:Uncharacterized protein n=1 Tax=Saprolegnia diclina (strain VS20) TaxID=1156394 RepID=T0PUW8_SAPDV|nr:hypothetical protein SDRG_12988 [Saprolegnia diclina VS20]EQC29319.1 hypothetical protein SDRG_12988 [Saprolegnia diclina VS20]|eukprot:XP_008617293.1 hypothetical protein SDRG_12988 [Saprolegnia diclina VS20]